SRRNSSRAKGSRTWFQSQYPKQLWCDHKSKKFYSKLGHNICKGNSLMSPQDVLNAQQLRQDLAFYEQQVRPLVGIQHAAYRDTLIKQFVVSLRRVRYVTPISQRDISNTRADPSSDLFDPER